MKNFFFRLSQKIQTFMRGRYGTDELNRLLEAVGFVLLLLSLIPPLRHLVFLSVALLLLTVLRTLSRNVARRQKERAAYLRLRGRVRGFFRLRRDKWRDRKTHRYYRCPGCRAVVRIRKPPRRMKITVTCPRCGKKFDKKA